MKPLFASTLVALYLATNATVPALAQTTPAPSPQATVAPSPAATAAPAATMHPGTANKRGQIRKLQAGTLSAGQIAYALTHMPQEINALRKFHKVKFANLRVQRVPTSLRRLMRTSQTGSELVAYEPVTLSDALAQTAAPSAAPGGLLGSLLNIIANINISDALNNALNGNTVNLSLSNVLNGNKIAIGQVVGVYVGGGGIITTLIR